MHSTDRQVLIVAEGDIEVEIAGAAIRAGENDVVALPSWSWRRIRAARDTILFQFSDRNMQERLGLWRGTGLTAEPARETEPKPNEERRNGTKQATQMDRARDRKA